MNVEKSESMDVNETKNWTTIFPCGVALILKSKWTPDAKKGNPQQLVMKERKPGKKAKERQATQPGDQEENEEELGLF